MPSNSIDKLSLQPPEPVQPVLTKEGVRNKLTEFLQNLTKFSSEKQKEILKQRVLQIEKQGRINFYADPAKDIEGYLKKVEEMIVSVGSPVELGYKPKLDPTIEKIYGAIFHEIPTFQELLTDKKLAHSFLIERDPSILKQTRELIQEILNEIDDIIQSPETAVDTPALQALIGNILSFYTFMNPPQGETLTVPLYVNEMWKKDTYTVNRIELTPSFMGSPVTALGLLPPGKESPPLLLFKGTSYPSDEGFGLQLLSDFNLFGSVGSYLFSIGKNKIESWLKQAHTQTGHKSRLFGVSLGGALSEHTVVSFPQYVEQVYAFNSPALMAFELLKWNRSVKSGQKMPEVNIYCQDNDPIPQTGLKWGKGWNIYKVFGPLKTPNSLIAHVRAFTADKECLILKVDRSSDANKRSRFLLTLLHQIVSIPFFMIGIVIWMLYVSIRHAIACISQCFKKRT